GTVRGVAWSTDGRAILGCCLDGSVRVWSVDTNDDATVTIRAGVDGTYSTTFSPDGATIAVSCFDGWVRLFDARTGALRREWDAHPGSTCHATAFSADGERLVTCSWDHTARVWNPDDGTPIATLDASDGVYAIAISPDGSLVATSGSTIIVWDVATGSRRHVLAADGAEPTRLEFSADGTRLASGWSDGIARVHDVGRGTLVSALGVPGPRVETVTFLPDEERLATGDVAGTVRVFPVSGGPARFTVDTGGRAVNHVASAGGRIAVATDQLWLVDAARGGIVFGTAPHDDTIWHLSWSPDGARLATCAMGGVIRILE
ncbi:MAG: hypothetical protein KDA25_05925, partial [Phycisphaerales bacterium]|nr:hypothetical protein [Phycisphaerales bacterium]